MNLPFFGKFTATKAHMLSGKTLQNWAKWYKADRPIAGNGIREASTPQGRVWHAAGGVDAAPCILGTLSPDAENAGKFKIEPGYISGGDGNGIGSQLLEKNNITPVIGDHLYIEVSWTAIKQDDVLLNGGYMTSAEIKQGTTITDDIIDINALTGKHRQTLGEWINDGNGNPIWKKFGCGSYVFKMCSNDISGTFSGVRT